MMNALHNDLTDASLLAASDSDPDAFRQKIIGQGFLGAYAPDPGVG